MVTNYKTETFDKKHEHFGGTIYSSDFDYRSMSDIASRIESDLKWEANLKKKYDSNKDYKMKGKIIYNETSKINL